MRIYAAEARRTATIAAVFLIGIVIAGGTLIATGSSVAALLSGGQALEVHHANAARIHEAALAESAARLREQERVADSLRQAAALYRSRAEAESERGGCGPICRSIERTAAQFDANASTVDQTLFDGESLLRDARLALAGLDFATAQEAVAETNAIDATTAVLSVGLVDGEGLEEVTQHLRRQVERIDTAPVEVPVSEDMRLREATLVYWKDIVVAWVGAAFIDVLPVLMLTLVALGVGEHRLREKHGVKRTTTHELRERDRMLEHSDNVARFPAE